MILDYLTTQPEGQFFERKSCYDRRGKFPHPRPVKDVVRDVAETLVAMANADGGTFGQKLVGADLYTASRDIRDLMRRGIVRLTKPKGRVYEVIAEPEKAVAEIPSGLAKLRPVLEEKGFVKNSDIQKALGVSPVQAQLIARRLVLKDWLEPIGEKRGRRYVPSARIIKPS
jgi:ATP-dependent DNA helicase RecG